MSIQLATQDLITRVKSVSSFSNRVGLTVGGQDIDPINRDIVLPAAWVVYVGDDLVEGSSMNPCSTLLKVNFVVKILVDYSDETTLAATSFPLLHEVVQAVQGGVPVPGGKWLYEGQGLTELSERMVWDQSYSVLLGI